MLNSTDALEIAKKYKSLKPGQEWAKGYHFKLTQPKDFPIINVIGSSPEGNFSVIEINAKTKEIISSQKKIYDKDGKQLWIDY